MRVLKVGYERVKFGATRCEYVYFDGETGYIGGMNIADRYIEGVPYGVWRDTHMRITGPAVGGLQYAFAVDWSFMGQSLLDESANTSRRDKPRFNAGCKYRKCDSEKWVDVYSCIRHSLEKLGFGRQRAYVVVNDSYFYSFAGFFYEYVGYGVADFVIFKYRSSHWLGLRCC